MGEKGIVIFLRRDFADTVGRKIILERQFLDISSLESSSPAVL